jgi:hypothetical protein
MQLKHESASSPDVGAVEDSAVHKKQPHFCLHVHVPDNADSNPGRSNAVFGLEFSSRNASFGCSEVEAGKGWGCVGFVWFSDKALWVNPGIGGKDEDIVSPTAGKSSSMSAIAAARVEQSNSVQGVVQAVGIKAATASDGT